MMKYPSVLFSPVCIRNLIGDPARRIDKTRYFGSALLACIFLLSACHGGSGPVDPAYRDEISKWRAERLGKLQAPDGWLSLAGLFWLNPGENVFGADPSLDIHLKAPGIPARAGMLFLDDDGVSLTPEPDSVILLRGNPVDDTIRLKSDAEDGGPDILHIGRLRAYVIVRGPRHALRVKDPEKVAGFEGLQYFPIDPDFRVEALLEAYEKPREISIATAVGIEEEMLCPGVLHFHMKGQAMTLQPWIEKAGQRELFIVFTDRTSGRQTYGAGRFLSATLNEDGTCILDFNRAMSPPCAFTRFATCPLAPDENDLPLAVTAGEKLEHPGGH